MEKKKLMLIANILVLVALVGMTSYSFFGAKVTKENETETVVQTNTMGLIFTGTKEIVIEADMIPGDSFTKTFTVENISNVEVSYNIYMDNVLNGFNSDLVYVLEDEKGIVINQTPLPITDDSKSYLKADIKIPAKTKKEYTIKIEFLYKADEDQNINQNKTFSGTLGIDTYLISNKYDFNANLIKYEEDGSMSPVTSGNLVFFSKKQDIVIQNNGKFSAKRLEGGEHEVYFLGETSPTGMTKEEVIANAICSGKFNILSGTDINLSCKEDLNYKISGISVQNKTDASDGIIAQVASSKIESGYKTLEVEALEGNNVKEIVSYNAHIYVYNGDQTFSGDMSFGDANDVATASTYASKMVIVKVNGDLTIESEATVRPYYNSYGGPKGFMLYVTGTLTNNGTIDNSHGAKAVGQNIYLWRNDDGYDVVPAVGGTGAARWYERTKNQAVGHNGGAGSGRQTGGGATGMSSFGKYAGAGSSGTSYSGGSGGGAGFDGNAGNATGNGGDGGKGGGSLGCGGAGNPGGGGKGSPASSTGGLLMIYANTYINNGNVTAIGGKGGTSSNNGGGGSGGGSINIFYNTKISDGTTNVSGGTSGGSTRGGYGGAGTVTYKQIDI